MYIRRYIIAFIALISLSLLGLKVNVRIESGVKKTNYIGSISVPQGSSVFDALATLQKKKQITLTSQSYGSLGKLVESINGVKNGKGKYWKFWVNNAFSRVGASTYLLKDKDNVLWRYDK